MLDDRRNVVRFATGTDAQTATRVHPAPYEVGSGRFPWGVGRGNTFDVCDTNGGPQGV